jgi:hypothetical protein
MESQEDAPSGTMNDLFLATAKSVYDAKDADSRTKANVLERLRSAFVLCIRLCFQPVRALGSAWSGLCFQI